MSKVSVYKPSSVILPPQLGLFREFYDKRSHLAGHPLLEQTDYEGYDRDTVFYDVFVDSQGKCLRALGPPMVNLARHLLPVDVFVSTEEGEKIGSVKHNIEERNRVAFHTFQVPETVLDASSLTVRFRFANGFEETVVTNKPDLKPVYLQFTTLQKENPIEWILDWMKYCRALDVERLLLYDNGSNYYEELATALREGPEDMELVLIPWPFNFGLIRSFYNNFCQAGQNNHASQCFGRAEWCGHFDLDEYPVLYRGDSLADYLKQQSRSTGLVRIDNYLVPYILKEPKETLPTARDFIARNKALRKKGHKYIVRTRALEEAKTHNGYVKSGSVRKLADANELVFFHYLGLTTNWKPYMDRTAAKEFDAEQHQEDKAVAEVLAKCDEGMKDRPVG